MNIARNEYFLLYLLIWSKEPEGEEKVPGRRTWYSPVTWWPLLICSAAKSRPCCRSFTW